MKRVTRIKQKHFLFAIHLSDFVDHSRGPNPTALLFFSPLGNMGLYTGVNIIRVQNDELRSNTRHTQSKQSHQNQYQYNTRTPESRSQNIASLSFFVPF